MSGRLGDDRGAVRVCIQSLGEAGSKSVRIGWMLWSEGGVGERGDSFIVLQAGAEPGIEDEVIANLCGFVFIKFTIYIGG